MRARTKVKICGITNLEDAQNAVDAGCDTLGFVFFKGSHRYINPLKAKEIIKNLPKKVIKIGVFVNSKEKEIKGIAKLCRLDILQFHGAQTPAFCKRFKGYKIIKAFRVKDKIDLKNILRYKTFAYLFDTFVKSKPGGTGRRFNWGLLKPLGGLKQPVFLSGGLNAKNVRQAIETVNPGWVDVSSSVEKSVGKKDNKKIKAFIRAVQNTGK